MLIMHDFILYEFNVQILKTCMKLKICKLIYSLKSKCSTIIVKDCKFKIRAFINIS